MTAIAAGRGGRNTALIRTNVGRGDRRVCTDKYWNVLFIVLFIIWIEAARHGAIHRKSDCETSSDNSEPKDNISSLNKTTDCNVTSHKKTITNSTSKWVSHIWGKNWLFDAITCNVGFLDAHYEKTGLIVIWMHLLVCVCLIIYSFASFRTDDLYHWGLRTDVLLLMLCPMTTRTFYHLDSQSDDSSHHTFLMSWSVPDITLFIIVCTKGCYRRVKPNTDIGDEIIERIRAAWDYSFFIYLGFLMSLPFIMNSLSNYKMNWDNHLSYVFVGVSCYMCLVFYYFILTVMSCSTSLSFDSEYCRLSHFCNALFFVVRYHFGTVCYHATLIFPRIHATFVMSEKEFRELPKFSAIYRLYLTHWKVHSLSLIVTASRGRDHSESIKELLKLFISDSPKLKNFQTHSQICRTCSALLIAINSLLLIGLWAHGVVLDPRFFVGSCVTYLIGTSIAYLVIAKLFDATGDAVWFQYVGNAIQKL